MTGLNEAWRLCRRPYADLTGDGARLAGGRWNRRGRAVVYLAEHPALAVLEVRVHLDVPLELLPFRTSTSTSKNAAPLVRFTRARPLRTDHGPAPA